MRGWTQRFDPRQTMLDQCFEIFHYHDPSPAHVELHHHDYYEVYFFLDGKMDYRVEGNIYHLEPGDLLLISPMELHQPIASSTDGDFERILLWVSKDFINHFWDGEFSLTRCFDTSIPMHTNLLRPSPAQRADITLRLGELLHEQYGDGYGGRLCAESILVRFLVELNRLAMQTGTTCAARGDTSPLISQVLSYINDHYYETITLDELAQRFYVSKYHLSHEFSRVMGTSLYRYVTLKRLLIAKQMLSTGISPGVVYSNCGFSDYANFYRAFKTQYGVSPSDCADNGGS